MLNQVQHHRISGMKDFLRKLFGQKLINIYHLGQAILANLIYNFPSRKLRVIGVTGTDGKTTTVNLIASVLQEAGYKTSFLSSINAQIGDKVFDTGLHTTTPSSFLLQKLLRKMADAGSEFVVLEVTSHALDQYRTWGIRFETAVLTNITPEHLDYHKTFEQYLEAKLKLLNNAANLVLPHDFPLSALGGRERIGVRGEKRNFGLDAKAQIWADNIQEDLKSTGFVAHAPPSSSPPYPLTLGKGKGGGEMRGSLRLPGKFNVLNALAAICVAQIYKLPSEKTIAGLEKVSSIPGRTEYLDEGQNFLAMVDFAHTANALQTLLRFVRPHISGQLILVFGAAGERDPYKRPEMGKVADELADLVIITREDNRSEKVEKICKEIAIGLKKKRLNQDYFIIPDRREAISFALAKAKRDDIVVVTGKGHEQSLNIDGQEVSWDDRKVIREELKAISYHP